MTNVKSIGPADGIVSRVIAEIAPRFENGNPEQVYKLVGSLAALDSNTPAFDNTLAELKKALPQGEDLQVLIEELAQQLRKGNGGKDFPDRAKPATSKHVRMEPESARHLVTNNSALATRADSDISDKLPDLRKTASQGRAQNGKGVGAGEKARAAAVVEYNKAIDGANEAALSDLKGKIEGDHRLSDEARAELLNQLSKRVAAPLEAYITEAQNSANEPLTVNSPRNDFVDKDSQYLIHLKRAIDTKKSALGSFDLLQTEKTVGASEVLTQEHREALQQAIEQAKKTIDARQEQLNVLRKNYVLVRHARRDEISSEHFEDIDDGPYGSVNQYLLTRLASAEATREHLESIHSEDAELLQELAERIESDQRLSSEERPDLLRRVTFNADIKTAMDKATEPLELTEGESSLSTLEESIKTKQDELERASRRLQGLLYDVGRAEEPLLHSSRVNLKTSIENTLRLVSKRQQGLQRLEIVLANTKRATAIAKGGDSLSAKRIRINELQKKSENIVSKEENRRGGGGPDLQISKQLLQRGSGYLQKIDEDLEKSGFEITSLRDAFYEVKLDGVPIQLRRFPDPPDKENTLKLQYSKGDDGKDGLGKHGVFEVSVAGLERTKPGKVKATRRALTPPNRLLSYVHNEEDGKAVNKRATSLFELLKSLPQGFSMVSLKSDKTLYIRRCDGDPGDTSTDAVFEYIIYSGNGTKIFDAHSKDIPQRLKKYFDENNINYTKWHSFPTSQGGPYSGREILSWEDLARAVNAAIADGRPPA